MYKTTNPLTSGLVHGQFKSFLFSGGSKGAGEFLFTVKNNLKPLTGKPQEINMPMEKKISGKEMLKMCDRRSCRPPALFSTKLNRTKLNAGRVFE